MKLTIVGTSVDGQDVIDCINVMTIKGMTTDKEETFNALSTIRVAEIRKVIHDVLFIRIV